MSDWTDFKSVRVAENEWMAFTDAAARFIHRQVLELGYRHDPDVQTHRFTGPTGGSLGGLTMQWQEIGEDAAVPADQSVPDISGLSLSQKSDLAAQLTRDGVGGFGAPGPAEGSDVVVGRAVMPGDRFTDAGKVREVIESAGDWVKVIDPETGKVSRMKRTTLDGWDAL